MKKEVSLPHLCISPVLPLVALYSTFIKIQIYVKTEDPRRNMEHELIMDQSASPSHREGHVTSTSETAPYKDQVSKDWSQRHYTPLPTQ
jgi:hypothetical protein